MKSYEDLVPLGRTVRVLRKARDLSQEELAELSGMHINYIGGIERGERNLGARNILALAKAFGIAPGELFEAYPASTGNA